MREINYISQLLYKNITPQKNWNYCKSKRDLYKAWIIYNETID